MTNIENNSLQETINDIKTEFFIREGAWRLLPDFEYSKIIQHNTNQNYTSTSLNTNLQLNNLTASSSSSNTNTLNNNTNGTSLNISNNNNNDPVKISFLINITNHMKLNNKNLRCDKCNNLNLNVKTTLINNEYLCKYCNNKILINNSGGGGGNAIKTDNSLISDFFLFNYYKEIYVYYYNGIKQPCEVKNLLDKKTYKSITATCHDINLDAYLLNSNTALIAVGFTKGEIHVFDAYKKDSSQFFNNNKLVDKTKATCIKWIPNSLNLFLISYSSGNMYLYDINLQQTTQQQQQNQTQQSNTQQTTQQLPSYQVLTQGNGYTIYTNKLTNAKSNSNEINNPLIKWSIHGEQNNTIFGINEFSFSPCSNYLALVTQDGFLRVFNYKETSLKCAMKSYFGGLLCLCWSPDGKYIATGGEDDLITIYSFLEMRVACRGRAHSSWINCVQFDYWAKLNAGNFNINDSFTDEDCMLNLNINDNSEPDSDVDDLNSNKIIKQNKVNFNRQRSNSSKKRLSSISDYEANNFMAKRQIFYRLGSVGQDNKIALWDLTEDVLKEKSHSRSRVTSINYTSNIGFTTNIGLTALDKQSLLPVLKQQTTTTTNNEQQESNNFFKRHKQRLNKVTKIVNHNSISNKESAKNIINSSNNLNQNESNEQINLNQKLNSNQVCPKLDEIPMIEPLICKKVSNERLTSLVFKEECFMIGCQDGVIYTWARPGKGSNVKTSKTVLSTQISNDLSQNSTSL